MKGRVVFVVGGASSGKSRFSCQLAQEWGEDVAYIATSIPLDDEMRTKIEEHKKRRPKGWKTVEEPYDLKGVLAEVVDRGILVVDCLTLYISNLLLKGVDKDDILDEVREFLLLLKKEGKRAVIVSNEVGWGVVPENPLGRRFRELAGYVNQVVQEMSDEVYLMVAGRGIKIK
jgi:adenosyl cobinamide kinase/adenosyl cobinamide phosphate guanylyltransferase